jgi:1-pyrroline-5-carboxylate dehydrogenase
MSSSHCAASGTASIGRVPTPVNEPTRSYAVGTPERRALKERLAAMASAQADIPLLIGGEEIRTGDTVPVVMPHDHRHVLGHWHKARAQDVTRAIGAAAAAHREWSAWSWEDRAAVFLRAADLLTTTWRDTLNAATMLGQSKTAYQAEIDAATELADFWRFNAAYAQDILAQQPLSLTGSGSWNRLDYRPLEGFVYAISPFNFTAIGGNLSGAPALMGNTVIWKPAPTAMLSAYYVIKLLEAAGLPPGVINFVPGDPAAISAVALPHPDLGGVHFTGSSAVFQTIWRTVGAHIAHYRSYPRLVGETGGKDFIVAHPSADATALAVAIVRGGFEYQGQKCSAASRVYVPASLWPEVEERTVALMREIRVGDVSDFRNFMGAVIDRRSFDKIGGYLELARTTATVIQGGGANAETGYFVEPTLVRTTDPASRLLTEEIFGPVVTAYVYRDAEWRETLDLIDRSSPYALTGAIFAQDRAVLHQAASHLRQTAGNLYLNDKPTGAVVGQQPFGGARASGTNDKAGSPLNLLRWVSARTIKETFVPARDFRYPFMDAE